jgi:hypothetical protein
VKVRHDEGVVTRIDPKPCVGIREGAGEASAGVRIGQPLSREISNVSGADAFDNSEGNTCGHASTSVRTARRGRRTWHVRTLLDQELGDLTADQRPATAGPHRKGEEP